MLGWGLLLKPFSKQLVKALWLHWWDYSLVTCDSHESEGSSHKGAASLL